MHPLLSATALLRPTVLTALAATLLGGATPSVAVPTVPGTSEVVVACLAFSDNRTTLGFDSLSCSESAANGTGFGDGNATATTGAGGGSPFVRADSDVTATASGGFGAFNAQGRAHADLLYQMTIAATLATPVPFSSIPVTISALGHVSASGSGSGGGNARATLSFGPLATPLLQADVAASVPGGPTSDSFTWSLTVSLQTALAYDISMHAEANSQAAVGPLAGGAQVGAGSAHAFVDPSFAFDQAAFNAFASQQGFATFPLDQHFEFQFTALPEPYVASLLGLVGLWTFGRRGGKRAGGRSTAPPGSSGQRLGDEQRRRGLR